VTRLEAYGLNALEDDTMDKPTNKGTTNPQPTHSTGTQSTGMHPTGTQPTGATGAGTESGSGDIRQAAESAREKARQGAEQAKGEVKGRAESLKHEAGEQVSRTASGLDAAADEFREQGQEGLADAVAHFAENLGDFAGQLESKSVDELARDVGRFAQRNPLLFAAGSVVAGILLSRFFKAHSKTTGSYREARWDGGDEYLPYDEYDAEGYSDIEPLESEARSSSARWDPATQTAYGDRPAGQRQPSSTSPRATDTPRGNGHGGER
jgi:hypothetical protein